MVLSRFGCHRSPFGSFPRVGKNSPAHRPMCKGTARQQAQLIAHHLAYNEGSPPVLPGRQRTTDITPQAAPARKRIASRIMRFHPQPTRRGVRGQPWCCLGLAATGRPLVLSREWERTPRLPAQRAKVPRAIRSSQRPTTPCTTRAAHRGRPAAATPSAVRSIVRAAANVHGGTASSSISCRVQGGFMHLSHFPTTMAETCRREGGGC